MATYQFKQYILPFKGFGGNDYEVQLWHHTDVNEGTNTVELTGMVNPFIVDYPEVNKLTPIRGSGAELNILSETNMQFLNLYHIDWQEWEVRLLRGSTVIWNGWLDTELYTEDYSETTNYPIQFTANDGFALLERYKFVESNGDPYLGLKSQWDVLTIILDKIGLNHTYLNVNLSTTFSDFSGSASSTILHETYINCSNYYDEDGEAMTMREVLEGTLRPYGAYIQHIESNLYINDIHSLAGNSATYKQYNFSTKAYVGTYSVSNPTVDISTIKWADSSQRFEMIPGINRQLISYSPYAYDNIVDNKISDIEEFDNISGTWSTRNGYEYKTLTGNSDWTLGGGATFEVSRDLDFDAEENATMPYLRFIPKASPVYDIVAEININPYLVLPAFDLNWTGEDFKPRGVAFHIEMEAMPVTKSNPYDDTTVEKVPLFYVQCHLGVGDDWANSEDFDTTWINISTTETSLKFLGTGNALDNKFNPNRHFNTNDRGQVFWANSDLEGNFKLRIRNELIYGGDILEVWIRSITIKMVHVIDNKQLGNDDVEYIGELNINFKEAAEDINLIHGTDTFLIDRGKLFYHDGTNYKSIDEWTRAGNTNKIEELLLNTAVSNFETSTVKLSGTLNDTFNALQIITDTSQLSGEKFAVLGQQINYCEGTNNVVLCQVLTDNLTLSM